MCGRTACTLAPDDICRACGRRTTDGRWIQPRWKDSPDGNQYYPSYNLSPTLFSPVMFSMKPATNSAPLNGEVAFSEWVVQPMRWGLIPSWHRGEANSIEYKMNNARSDGLLSKASFKKPLECGRRCVVLADGNYEWRTLDGKKQPYFIYFPQETSPPSDGLDVNENQEIKAELKDAEYKECHATDSEEYKGKRLLTMAGLYDVWKPRDSDPPLFSYSVITVDAHAKLAWMHDRMPAILNGEEEIKAWLDYESVPLGKAMNLIRPTDCVQWHAVSSLVNNSRNKSEDCVKLYVPQQEVNKKPSASANLMKSWLSAGSKRSSSEYQSSTNKKQKD